MNHEEGVLFHATLPNTSHLEHTHTHTRRCRTSLSPSSNWWRVLYCQIDFLYSAITMAQERRRRRKDAIINNFIFQSAYLCRTNKKRIAEKNGAGAQIALNCFAFFFLSRNVTDYHETRKLNSFFFLFFHLSDNWFDISKHFKGCLAWRLCSKLQYKAEDLPLAECQVYARLPPTPPLPLLPPFLSIVPFPTAQPKKKENKSFWNSSQTLYNLSSPPCLCAFVCLCPGVPFYCNTIKAQCVYQ